MQENGAKQAEMRTEFPPVIGAALPRVDGPVKTTGRAQYAADYHFPGLVYAVPVCATIANGKIRSMDTAAAEKMPGVVAILHHGNIGPLYRTSSGHMDEDRQPFEDDVVSYWGQYVALGGVGTIPWRAREAEAELVGKPATREQFVRAAEAALKDAKPRSENGFKVELAKRCIVHALTTVSVA